MNEHDYSRFDQSPDEIGGNLMSSLVSLADQQEAAKEEVDRLKSLLDEAERNFKRISEIEIPKLMDGIDGKLNLPDGRVVTISEKIRAGISSDNKNSAMNWLNDNNHGALIKRRFIIEFGRDQEEWAREFETYLAESQNNLNVKKEQSVHWQTLDAFVREQLTEGSEIPLDLFGVFRQRSAKVTGAK